MDVKCAKSIVKIERNLNIENSRKLKKELVEMLHQGVRQVELDFSLTETVDSSGLGKLLLFNEKFKAAGGSFKVINVINKGVAEMFQLINLAKFLHINYKN